MTPAFLEHEEINRVVLRFCQFESLHDLVTSLPESRAATLGNVAVSALELSGLVWRRVVTSIGIQRLAAVESADITDLSQDDGAKSIPNAVHRTKDGVFRNCLSNILHLQNNLVSSILSSREQINALGLRQPDIRIITPGGYTVLCQFIDSKTFLRSISVGCFLSHRFI